MKSSQALQYHQKPRPGKIGIYSTKPCDTQEDLSLAYTPGVAVPSQTIARQAAKAYQYTNKGNLVGVITNGTAVLGLGNIGALASKPVMEGKSVLFQKFAGIDAFDIEINETDPDLFIETVRRLEPTFGGINLEDIAAPECFAIEDELQKQMNIPVFHDDQHGTAVIAGAALLNALELVGKDITKIKVVISGAGAAGIRCAEHFVRLGVKKTNIYLVDSKGLVHKQRANLDAYKRKFTQGKQDQTLAQTMQAADVFLGVSVGNILTDAMLHSMAKQPIVFALANPTPEVSYERAMKIRPDSIVATGRSDYPNQINNVLGFPSIFRGALDVRATAITDTMKLAATYALADLAHQRVPAYVLQAYKLERIKFGSTYIVPKPFDKRVLVEVASAVAQAAMQDGVAQQKITVQRYREQLTKLVRNL